MLKAVILDFDGVILESIDIKTRAFRELFSNYPEHVDKIVKYHETHGGVSRYKKFEYFFNAILKAPVSEQMLTDLGERFSDLVLEEVKKCPYVPGARDFLETYSEDLKLYVASGTPENELRNIVSSRNLDMFFEGVYGSPRLKSEIIELIRKNEGLKKSEVLFVGDSETDFKEATRASVQFIARIVDSSITPNSPLCVGVIEDLFGLIDYLERYI